MVIVYECFHIYDLRINSSFGRDLHYSPSPTAILKTALTIKNKDTPQNKHTAKHVAASPLNWQSFTVRLGFSFGQSYMASRSPQQIQTSIRSAQPVPKIQWLRTTSNTSYLRLLNIALTCEESDSQFAYSFKSQASTAISHFQYYYTKQHTVQNKNQQVGNHTNAAVPLQSNLQCS